MYIKAREEALNFLYRSKDFNKARPMELEADFEEVAASCGHFSFSLQDFANDIRKYLDILEELKIEMDERPNGRTWKWLKFWRRKQSHPNAAQQPEEASGIDPNIHLFMTSVNYEQKAIMRYMMSITRRQMEMLQAQHRRRLPFPTSRKFSMISHSLIGFGNL